MAWDFLKNKKTELDMKLGEKNGAAAQGMSLLFVVLEDRSKI